MCIRDRYKELGAIPGFGGELPAGSNKNYYLKTLGTKPLRPIFHEMSLEPTGIKELALETLCVAE